MMISRTHVSARPTGRDSKVLGPRPKDLILGPDLQIFWSGFRTDKNQVLKSPI